MGAFVDGVLRRALSQDGVREVGTNTGRAVDTYLRSVGLGPGFAWCAAFVFWCISEEARAWQIEPPMLRSAYCPAIHEWARAAGLLRSNPEPGDVFLRLVNYPEGRFASHTGFVSAVIGDRFEAIEGNTNAGGSSEGDGVYRRSRPINSDYAFVRWIRLLPQPVTEPQTYRLVINGQPVADMPVVGGRSLCPLRAWAEYWGMVISWDEDAQVVLLDGRPVPAQVSLIEGRSYAPISELIQGTGLASRVNVAARSVELKGSLH